MRLPKPDDPHGNSEGSVPKDILLKVLAEHDVDVEFLGNNEYYLSVGDISYGYAFSDPVGGLLVRTLSRLFDVPLMHFYVDPLTEQYYNPKPS